MTLVSQEIITEDEAEILTRNICARIWRTYGEVYHGQEWIGLDNIPEDGALIVYYHGPVPVDYLASWRRCGSGETRQYTAWWTGP